MNQEKKPPLEKMSKAALIKEVRQLRSELAIVRGSVRDYEDKERRSKENRPIWDDIDRNATLFCTAIYDLWVKEGYPSVEENNVVGRAFDLFAMSYVSLPGAFWFSVFQSKVSDRLNNMRVAKDPKMKERNLDPIIKMALDGKSVNDFPWGL